MYNGVEMDAFNQWAEGLISDALREELTLAAGEAHLDLARFVAEVLESFAAARRLPKVPTSPVRAQVYPPPAEEGRR